MSNTNLNADSLLVNEKQESIVPSVITTNKENLQSSLEKKLQGEAMPLQEEKMVKKQQLVDLEKDYEKTKEIHAQQVDNKRNLKAQLNALQENKTGCTREKEQLTKEVDSLIARVSQFDSTIDSNSRLNCMLA